MLFCTPIGTIMYIFNYTTMESEKLKTNITNESTTAETIESHKLTFFQKIKIRFKNLTKTRRRKILLIAISLVIVFLITVTGIVVFMLTRPKNDGAIIAENIA